MQTFLPEALAGTEADEILRTCVHCGMCNATCPTYLVERNELDGPRGRIYLIKQMLEGDEATSITRQHLDRCLTCRACETTCPSGVEYHRLLDIGRAEIQRRAPRPAAPSLLRWLLRQLLSRRGIVVPLMALGRLFRPLLPAPLREHLPLLRPDLPAVRGAQQRRVILAQGCVQPAMSPTTLQAAALVLDRLGIEGRTLAAETCCGALAWHSDGQAQGLGQARRNVDTWWRALEEGAEAIVTTASGCSSFIRDYPRLFADDPVYSERATRVVESLRDIAEFLACEDLSGLAIDSGARVAWHCPCTAQHGQSIDGPARDVLTRLGFELPAVRDSHLCCGSAGSYSLFHPAMASELRRRKLDALEASAPEQIITANIGCQSHLASGTETPVVHWVELVARSLRSTLDS